MTPAPVGEGSLDDMTTTKPRVPASSTQNDARRRLIRAAGVFAAAVEARDDARARLQAAIRDADEAGIQRSEIVELSGVARQTVYDAIRAAD